MRVYDIIDRKKKGYTMTKEEIVYLIEGYVKGEIPDYQVAAWLMAVYYQGMTDEELLNLTLTMRDSGDQVDLSAIHGIKVDKHSTGGVGDKTTIVIAPLRGKSSQNEWTRPGIYRWYDRQIGIYSRIYDCHRRKRILSHCQRGWCSSDWTVCADRTCR